MLWKYNQISGGYTIRNIVGIIHFNTLCETELSSETVIRIVTPH